ncbi:hypothetical protein NFJ02_30g77630 [Pycnococcus provasolii]
MGGGHGPPKVGSSRRFFMSCRIRYPLSSPTVRCRCRFHCRFHCRCRPQRGLTAASPPLHPAVPSAQLGTPPGEPDTSAEPPGPRDPQDAAAIRARHPTRPVPCTLPGAPSGAPTSSAAPPGPSVHQDAAAARAQRPAPAVPRAPPGAPSGAPHPPAAPPGTPERTIAAAARAPRLTSHVPRARSGSPPGAPYLVAAVPGQPGSLTATAEGSQQPPSAARDAPPAATPVPLPPRPSSGTASIAHGELQAAPLPGAGRRWFHPAAAVHDTPTTFSEWLGCAVPVHGEPWAWAAGITAATRPPITIITRGDTCLSATWGALLGGIRIAALQAVGTAPLPAPGLPRSPTRARADSSACGRHGPSDASDRECDSRPLTGLAPAFSNL